MAQSNVTMQPVPRWWQLPFALALAKGKLFPSYCYLCGIYPIKPIAKANLQTHWFNQISYLCESCHTDIRWQHSEFQLEIPTSHQLLSITGVASSFYQFPYQQIIRAFKNSHQLDKFPLLVHAVRQLDKPLDCHTHNSVIIPMPTTLTRLTQRGFDPVTLLVQYLSFYWQIPIFTGVVREDRQKQQGLSREQRLTNTQNAFYFTALPAVSHVILFDDVATTGATLQSLAECLIRDQLSLSHSRYQIHARVVAHG